MARIMLAPAFALLAMLAGNHVASAAEPDKALSGFTMTLGGKGTATEAATATDDTELTHFYRGGYRGYYGGYRGYYGGFGGYRGYYGGYGGYRGYYGGLGYGGYRGYYGGYGFYRPYFAAHYRPYYYGYSPYIYGSIGFGYSGYGYNDGCYYGVNGTADDASAPVVSLGLAAAKNPGAVASGAPLRYDGGPANPVPQVKPDAEPRAPTASPGLPVSFKKETASPYRYKAYGER